MATLAHEVQSAPCHPADVEPVSPQQSNPRQRDGGFLYAVPDSHQAQPLPFAMHVSDWQERPNIYRRGVGLIETALVSVQDDGIFGQPSRFIVRTTIPEEQKYATSVDMMPPLGVEVDGYMTHIAFKLAQQGVHSRIVGTNQKRGHTLEHDTQANLTILRAHDMRQAATSANCTPDTSADVGYSMGEMKAFAKQKLAPMFGWKVVYNKGIDPCVAEITSYEDLVTKAMLAYFLADAAEIPKNVYHDVRYTGLLPTARRMRHWLGTASLSLVDLANTYDKWTTIMTGEAGTFLQAAPKDTPIVLHSSDGSKLNHRTIFEAQLADFTNVRTVHEPGRHLSYASALATANIVSDVVTALELIESGASGRDVVDATCQPILRRR